MAETSSRLPEEGGTRPDGRTPKERAWFRAWVRRQDAKTLCTMLRRIERRLGKPEERTDDLGDAEDIGHALNNLRTVEGMWKELGLPPLGCDPKEAK